MRVRIGLAIVGLVLGTVAIAAELEGGALPPNANMPMGKPIATPIVVAPTAIVVDMTAATLGQDCGESPVPSPHTMDGGKRKAVPVPDSDAEWQEPACRQTSMQLSVLSGKDAVASTLRVKKVEVFDETGKRLFELTARGASSWSATAGAYQPWDQKVGPGQSLAIRYVLSQPNWTSLPNRFNRMFTVKAVVTVAGGDRTIARDTFISAETSFPAHVDT